MTHKVSDCFGHITRFSDSSQYDEICELCGRIDGRGQEGLYQLCPEANLVVQYRSYAEWLNHADSHSSRGDDIYCIDAKDRPCLCLGDFKRARDEAAFPIRCFHLQEEEPTHD